MKKKNLLAATGIVLALLALVLVIPALQAADSTSAKITTSVFEIEGMTCGGCETGVKMAVKKLDGISKVKASYKEGQAEVSYDATKVTPKQIVAAIAKLGYTAKLQAPPAKKG